MSDPAPIPPVAMLANDAVQLLDAIVARHGGSQALGVAGVEIALQMVRLHGDARRATGPMERVRVLEAIARLTALLPAPVVDGAAPSEADGERMTSDGAIALHVVDGLTDEELVGLAGRLLEFCPSSDVLADLVAENAGLRAQISDARMAFGAHDFERLNGALGHDPGSDHRLVDELQREIVALRAELEALREVRAGPVYLSRRQEASGASTPTGWFGERTTRLASAAWGRSGCTPRGDGPGACEAGRAGGSVRSGACVVAVDQRACCA